MHRFFGMILVAMTICATVSASGFRDGYINAHGYRFQAATGFWIWPASGELYQRTAYEFTDNYGYRRVSWHYVRVNVAVKVVLPTYRDPDWRTKLLEVAGTIRKDAQEQAAFSEAVRQLGLEGLARVPGLPANMYGQYGFYGQSSYGASGTTLYGAQLTVKDVWGDTSPSILYQQAAALAKGQQALSSEATQAFAELVSGDAAARARIAEIFANRDAAIAFLQALKTPHSRTIQLKVGQEAKPEQKFGSLDQAKFTAMVENRCATCHTGDKVKGNFDLNALAGMDFSGKRKVWGRITHADPAKRMPLSPTLGVGTPLTEDELRAWFGYLFSEPMMNGAKE